MVKTSKVNQLPKSWKKEDFEYEKEKPKPVEQYFVNNLLIEQLRKLKIDFQPNIEDITLDNFLHTVADVNSYEKQMVHMIRIKTIDRLNNKHEKKEFLVHYENWTGYDSQGHKLPSVSDYPAGTIDKQVMFSVNYKPDGTKYNEIEGVPYNVYTKEFTPKAVDEALESCAETELDRVQFSCVGIGRTYGGFSYEEFRNLSYEELCERGRLGQVNFPVDQEILEKQREISELRQKKQKQRSK